jgi:hypothetical protein
MLWQPKGWYRHSGGKRSQVNVCTHHSRHEEAHRSNCLSSACVSGVFYAPYRCTTEGASYNAICCVQQP